MKLRAILVALFALAASCQQLLAWGSDGHQLVGSIGDHLLNPHAKQQVQNILGFELRVAAPWADCVRSVMRHTDGSFEYISNPRFNKPCLSFETDAEKPRMVDYVSRNFNACVNDGGKKGCADTYHFADVAIQHDHYERGLVGTNEHDIVGAINAAIMVLKDKPATAPFSIKDKKEALFLLAHFVGDMHQPLHVGAVYLNVAGKRLNPDVKASAKSALETRGGNLILEKADPKCKGSDMHSEWDDILDSLGTSASDAMVAKAKAVPPTPGGVENFAATWATDTILQARSAFKGVSFKKAPCKGQWVAKFANRKTYLKSENAIKQDQLAKGGARLAQLLNTIWP